MKLDGCPITIMPSTALGVRAIAASHGGAGTYLKPQPEEELKDSEHYFEKHKL